MTGVVWHLEDDAEQEVPEQEGPSELETEAELFIVAQLISRRLRRLPPSVEPYQ